MVLIFLFSLFFVCSFFHCIHEIPYSMVWMRRGREAIMMVYAALHLLNPVGIDVIREVKVSASPVITCMSQHVCRWVEYTQNSRLSPHSASHTFTHFTLAFPAFVLSLDVESMPLCLSRNRGVLCVGSM